MFSAESLSRIDIRQIALDTRKIFGMENTLCLPVIEILEQINMIDEDAYFEIIAKDEWENDSDHAKIDISKKCIIIREDIYDGACNGNGRDRMTVAHEIGHLVLIIRNGIKLYYNDHQKKIKAYIDPEWQATCFAGELLMKVDLIKDMRATEIAKECGVSEDVANYQLSKILK